MEETGLGRGFISELERGLVNPTLLTLARVASVLGVTIADLVAGSSTREKVFVLLRRAPPSRVAELADAIAAEVPEVPRR